LFGVTRGLRVSFGRVAGRGVIRWRGIIGPGIGAPPGPGRPGIVCGFCLFWGFGRRGGPGGI